MAGVLVVYAGFIAALAGVLSLVRPLRFLGIRSRWKAPVVFACGALLAVAGMNLPAVDSHVDGVRTSLDEFAPRYQFHEVHQTCIAAPRSAVYAAIKAVAPEEILLFRTLTAALRVGRRTPASITNAPGRRPILETATRTGFWPLADRPDREIVIGTLMPMVRPSRYRVERTPAGFRAFDAPGVAKITMNFYLEDAGSGCLVTTETRVYGTERTARRRFAGYWRVIYPGSSLIRRMWLRAIRLRAERAVS